MKVFLGLSEVAGYFSNLKKGFKSIGIESTLIDLNKNKFQYEGNDNENIFLLKLIFPVKNLKDKNNNKIIKIFFLSIEIFLRIFLFIQILLTHDVFVFGLGTTFFKYKELPILKFFNKKIIYIFFGSDSRPPYLDGFIMADDNNLTIKECIKLTEIKKKNMSTISKFADIIIDNPAQGLFQEKNVISILGIGFPYKNDIKYDNTINLKDNSKIKILHSPSHVQAKGSEFIRQCITNLKNKGYDIDFIEVTGKPNSYVIEKIIECDFIVDQVYSDTPMAAFATEAAFFGKPAILSGYYSDEMKDYIIDSDIPPTIYCKVENLESEIENMINNKDFRLELGLNAQKFVKEYWSPEAVAKKYLKLINNQIDKHLILDPYKFRYIYGSCINKIKLKITLKDMINNFGIKSLQLSDKPELEKLFLDFIKEE